MASFDYELSDTSTGSGIEVAVVSLTGTIDSAKIESFDEMFKKLLADNHYNVILDLQNLQYLNSRALGLLVRWTDTFAEKQGKLILMQVPDRVMTMIATLGLEEFFKIAPDDKSALASIEVWRNSDEEIVEMHLKAPDNKGTSRQEPEPPRGGGGNETTTATIEAVCGQCGLTVTMGGPGRYRCPRCRAYLNLDKAGKVTTSAPSSSDAIELILPPKAVYLEALEQLCLSSATVAGLDQADGKSFFKAVVACAKYLIQEALGEAETERLHLLMQTAKGKLSARIYCAGKILPLQTSELAATEPLAKIAQSLDRLEFFANNKGNFFTLDKMKN